MSLDFSYEDVVEFPGMWLSHEEMYGSSYEGDKEEPPQYMGPELNAVIWSTMDTGISRITEDNWEEAFKRYCLMRGLIRKEPFLTALDFKRCIGLYTNATPYKSRKQWLREYVDRCMENMSRWIDVEHTCTVCGNTSDSWRHKAEDEAGHEFTRDEKVVLCQKCREAFPNAEELAKHVCDLATESLPSEKCDVCGQDDNCGDCNHTSIEPTDDQYHGPQDLESRGIKDS